MVRRTSILEYCAEGALILGSTIPRRVVDCIAHGREPSVQELCAVAEHIRSDVKGRRDKSDSTGFSDCAARLIGFRAAHAALTGCKESILAAAVNAKRWPVDL